MWGSCTNSNWPLFYHDSWGLCSKVLLQVMKLAICPWKHPQLMFFNTEPRSHTGAHWVAVYIDESGFTTCFDPNRRFLQQTSFINFLAKHAHKWWYWKKYAECGFTRHVNNIAFVFFCCIPTNLTSCPCYPRWQMEFQRINLERCKFTGVNQKHSRHNSKLHL